jgi:Outer membrane lipoprotein carrier protein LolA-like
VLVIHVLLVSFLAIVGAPPVDAQTAGVILAPEESLQGRFVQERHLAGFAAPLRSQGRFLLRRDRGLIWRGEKPFEAVTVITPAGLLQEVDGTEASRMSTARLPFLARFYEMLSGALSGDWTSMQRAFVVIPSGDPQAWTIELRPRHADVDADVVAIEAMIIKGSSFVDTVDIRKPGGDWERLTFLDQVVSAGPLSGEDERLFESAGK